MSGRLILQLLHHGVLAFVQGDLLGHLGNQVIQITWDTLETVRILTLRMKNRSLQCFGEEGRSVKNPQFGLA